MTKYIFEQDKINTWIEKKSKWANQLISLYPKSTNFTTIAEKSRKIQSSVTQV